LSIPKATRGVLIARPYLIANLAKTPENQPAVYRTWVQNVPRPYIALTSSTFAGPSWETRTGPLNVDIFADGPSTVLLEKIRDDVINALDRTMVEEDGHYLRYYLAGEGEVPEDQPDVVHWNVQLEVRYLRRAFVEGVIART
jgi:hypothetical protein